MAAEFDLEVEGLGGLWHTPPTPRSGNTFAAPGPRPQGIVVGFGSSTEAAYPRALDALVRTLSWR